MLRVLYISHYSELNGANLSLINLLDVWHNQYEIYPIILLPMEGPIVKQLKKRGIKYIIMPFYSWEYEKEKFNKPKIYIVKHNIENKYLFYKILKRLENERIEFDLVHSNSSVIDIGQYLADKYDIPHVWHLREYGKEDYGLEYCISTRKVINKYKRATKLIAISKSVQNYYEKFLRTPIELIYNGVPDTNYRNEYKNNILKICCVGLIHRQKNQLELIKAGKVLLDEGNSNFKIYLVGSEELSYKKELLKYIENNRMNAYVKFLGRNESIYEILSGMDVGVIPSIKEAFGRVTIEYMISGIPVIGSNTGGTKELIENGKTGYLYESGNYYALADTLRKMLQDRSKRINMGKYARQYAKEKFTIEITAKKIMQLYLDIIKEKH
ncbi:MAG: glycosyltransferase family 4 protein [Thomasclavelia spiroformis]|uniref:glycosyltransferase family 4 protein n=1 Tax=Thomasclavelia spiroformis TaxID=29348 RepID=UPI003990B80A